MGGRGARFGVSEKGKKYGTEYKSVSDKLNFGRIKFVKKIDDRESKKRPLSASPPQETMTKGRIYVTINAKDRVNNITFYKKGKLMGQIDLTHKHIEKGKLLENPHLHKGYEHGEKGSRNLNKFEKRLVDRIIKIWNNGDTR